MSYMQTLSSHTGRSETASTEIADHLAGCKSSVALGCRPCSFGSSCLSRHHLGLPLRQRRLMTGPGHALCRNCLWLNSDALCLAFTHGVQVQYA